MSFLDASLSIRLNPKTQGGGKLILRPWVPTVVLQRLVHAFEHSRCKPIYKVLILRPMGANPKNLGANGSLHRLGQVLEHSRCKLIYKVPVLRPRGLILRPWAPTVVLQKIVQAFTRSGRLSIRCRS